MMHRQALRTWRRFQVPARLQDLVPSPHTPLLLARKQCRPAMEFRQRERLWVGLAFLLDPAAQLTPPQCYVQQRMQVLLCLKSGALLVW